ncbi:MAG: deoxynucleoside kinase [bacterium]
MYILEGNIGAGKSTFLELLNKNIPEIKTYQEPKDNWTKQVYGQSLLANFYKEPKRWAYTMETLTMMSRAKLYMKDQLIPDQRFVLERSVYSGHYCFALNGYQHGFFTQIEWDIYTKWVDFLINQNCKPPHGFIYLKANPDVCFKRIQKRNRISEKDVSLSYIKQIDEHHDNFLIKRDGVFESLKNVPVLILDCNEDFVENEQILNTHLYKVKNFIEQTIGLIQEPKTTSLMKETQI